MFNNFIIITTPWCAAFATKKWKKESLEDIVTRDRFIRTLQLSCSEPQGLLWDVDESKTERMGPDWLSIKKVR